MVATPERFLVPVEDSEASEKAVTYLGRILAGDSSKRVRLFHVEAPIGPYFLSLHGDQRTEPRSGAEPAEAKLVEEAKARSRPVIEKMVGILERAGFAPENVETSWFVASREDSLPFEVLRVADEEHYDTIVVGRSALPWHKELFHQHLGDRLVKKAGGHTVWVVE